VDLAITHVRISARAKAAGENNALNVCRMGIPGGGFAAIDYVLRTENRKTISE
jgi:hypothetical protein